MRVESYAMARARYREVTHADEVDRLKKCIPPDRIRVQDIEYPTEMWGIVVLDGLPFYFRLSRSHGICEDSGIDIHGKEFKKKEIRRPTDWNNHVPYKPLDFTPPIFAGKIDDEDRKFVLATFGIKEKDINNAVNRRRLDRVYREQIGKRAEKYQGAYDRYYRDVNLGTALLQACEQFEPIYNKSLKRKEQ